MLTIYTAVNKDFLAFNSIIDRGGIFSLETDKLELQSVSCVDYNFSAFYDRSLSS